MNTRLTNKLTQDIRSSGNNNFIVKHAIVITYIYDQRRFQIVLVTGETETLAVLNYEQLDGYRSDNRVIFNEPECSQNKILTYWLNMNLLNGTNTGRRGRYVFNLTTIGCFKPVIGIKLTENNVRQYNGLFTILPSSSGRVFEMKKIEVIALHDSEYLTDSPRRTARTNAVLPVIKQTDGIHYFYAYSEDSYKNINLKNLIVFGDTLATSPFNYGAVNFTSGYGIQCKGVSFETTMKTTPAIKLTAQLPKNNMNNYVKIWMVNVSRHGFDVSTKEIITFSGERNFKINFVAVSQNYMDITEIDHALVQQS